MRVKRVGRSQLCDIRYRMEFDFRGREYITDDNPRNHMNNIFRATGSLLPLNCMPSREVERWMCSMCNPREHEDFVHFLTSYTTFINAVLDFFLVCLAGVG